MAWVETSREAPDKSGNFTGAVYYRCSRCKAVACMPLRWSAHFGECPFQELTPCACEDATR